MKGSLRKLFAVFLTAVVTIGWLGISNALAEGVAYLGGSFHEDRWEDAEYQVLIKNVNIFDGKQDKLIKGMDVLVIGEHIAKIRKAP
ncbi:MAG: hypothetical protein JRF64_10790 [Deltaproteobacteria bacterium]|nr:hypothetical protein [Deltaproteobacteria bacterium]